MMPLNRLTEIAENVLLNVRKTAQYVPPTRRDLINNLALSRRSMPGRDLPARPSGRSSDQLDRSILDMINVSAMPAPTDGKRASEYLEKQAQLSANAQPANFAKGTYDQSKVVGATFEQQRALDDFGMGGREIPSSATLDEALGLNKVFHDPGNVKVQEYMPANFPNVTREYTQQQSLQNTLLPDLSAAFLDAPANMPPTKQNIANVLSQLTPEDIAKIHRGNVAASNPLAPDDFIGQLTAEGVGSGPATRLGALADNERAFNDLLQGGSYRELFGDLQRIARMSDREKAALSARHEEMLMDELTHPDAHYLDRYTDENRQKLSAFRYLMQGDGYSEAAHRNANLSTTTENLTEGASSGARGNGMLNFSTTESSNSLMGMLDRPGMGIAASAGLGAVLGGTANYAMGGEFSEGAMMGGLAGGGIAIGARAIGANSASIEGYLQRRVLKDQMPDTAAAAGQKIAAMSPAEAGQLGTMDRMAYNRLMQSPDSPGIQSRHMVIGGSMLAGVAFTGRRNDKRRGFNAHRGNRI